MTIEKQARTLLASAARVATPADIEIDQAQDKISITGINEDSLGGQLTNIHIIVDVTAVAATPSVQPAIEGKDPASGKFYDLLAGIAAITGVGTTVYRIGRDIISAANLSQQDALPDFIKVSFTHADADSITYSVGINYEMDRSRF